MKFLKFVKLGAHLPDLPQVFARERQQDLRPQWEIDWGDNQQLNASEPQFNMLEM